MVIVKIRVMCMKNEQNINLAQKIYTAMEERGYTVQDLVDSINDIHPDLPIETEEFRQRLDKGDLRYTELFELAEIMEYPLEFIPKTWTPYPTRMGERRQARRVYNNTGEKQVKMKGQFFDEIVIRGANAEEAADYYRQQDISNISKEILMQMDIQRKFNVAISRSKRTN